MEQRRKILLSLTFFLSASATSLFGAFAASYGQSAQRDQAPSVKASDSIPPDVVGFHVPGTRKAKKSKKK